MGNSLTPWWLDGHGGPGLAEAIKWAVSAGSVLRHAPVYQMAAGNLHREWVFGIARWTLCLGPPCSLRTAISDTAHFGWPCNIQWKGSAIIFAKAAPSRSLCTHHCPL